MEDNKIIRFFNYEAALSFYTKQIDGMRQGYIKRTGIKKIAKPALLLAIIRGVESGALKYNRFCYADIENIYDSVFERYLESANQQGEKTPLYNPFYYLHTDGFWHHSMLPHSETLTDSPSRAWINRNVEYAYVDEELWLLLCNREYRQRLKDFVINSKILPRHTKLLASLKAFAGWLLAI